MNLIKRAFKNAFSCPPHMQLSTRKGIIHEINQVNQHRNEKKIAFKTLFGMSMNK